MRRGQSWSGYDDTIIGIWTLCLRQVKIWWVSQSVTLLDRSNVVSGRSGWVEHDSLQTVSPNASYGRGCSDKICFGPSGDPRDGENAEGSDLAGETGHTRGHGSGSGIPGIWRSCIHYWGVPCSGWGFLQPSLRPCSKVGCWPTDFSKEVSIGPKNAKENCALLSELPPCCQR